MKLNSKLLLLTLLFPLASQASTVAIVDSGSDFEHKDLAGRQWVNPSEIAGNRVDDDRNGKVDDVNGWNFAEDYNRIFFRDHLKDINPITYKLFEIIARKQAKSASAEDEAFWEENVMKLTAKEKEELLAHLNYYGQYAHGTHVAGIVSYQAPQAKLLVGRIFPDTLPPEYKRTPVHMMKGVMDYIYQLLAMVSNGIFDQVSVYLNDNHADVANYSVGISMHMLAENFLAMKGNKNPTEDELAAESQRIFKQYEPYGEKWVANSPNTLFVIAAGNDGRDNDRFPTFPANIRSENAITVAASQDFDSLAEFSNYGINSVDLAAPGVAIESSVPALDRERHLPMSGTSMATPFVTGVSAHIKDLNPELKPSDIRAILMQTVDPKPWLQGKVISGGVVNPERAYAAAEKSRTMELSQAIAAAKTAVPGEATVHHLSVRVANPAVKTSPELQRWAKKLVF